MFKFLFYHLIIIQNIKKYFISFIIKNNKYIILNIRNKNFIILKVESIKKKKKKKKKKKLKK